MANSILRYVNNKGIPCISDQSATLTTEAETFYFNRFTNTPVRFQGQIFIKINNTNAAPSTAVPIQFATIGDSNSIVTVYDKNGTELTTATFTGNGVYIGFYDSDTGILRLLNN